MPVSNGAQTDPPFLWDGLPHLESMEGFFFLLAEDGRVLFISENVDKFIGYSNSSNVKKVFKLTPLHLGTVRLT